MSNSDLVWASLILAGAAFEAYTLTNGRQEDTFSATTRRLFRVRTRAGALAFGILWASASTWFFGHVLYGWPFPLS